MKDKNEFIELFMNKLKSKKIKSKDIDIIESELNFVLAEYRISKVVKKIRSRNAIHKYRVRYKVYDPDKRIWLSKVDIKEASKGSAATEMVIQENPECKITSTWLV